MQLVSPFLVASLLAAPFDVSAKPACSTGECADEENSLLQLSRHRPLTQHSAGNSTSVAMVQEGKALPEVRIVGRQLLIDGVAVHLKGINWNPVDKGADQGAQGSAAINFAGRVDEDSEMMQEAGINVIRPYAALVDKVVLDKLYARGIYVMNTVLAYYGQSMHDVEGAVNAVKDHPAIIMWVVGNEWNYNGLYRHHGCQSDWNCFDQTRNQLRDAAWRIKEIDPTRPVTTIYGELPEKWLVDWFGDSIDTWGLNVYSGKAFGDRFSRWKQISSKPCYFGEYGADAYNQVDKHSAWSGWVDESAQAVATRELTQEIVDNSAVNGGVCIGGLLFEFNDEWWKAGDPNRQDVGGVAPGGGPWPDLVFNEEYWGIVTIDRVKRQAFYAYRDVATPGGGTVTTPEGGAVVTPAPTSRPDFSECGAPDAQCESDLAWAMDHGIHQHPQWYPGLSPSSSSADFQKHLSSLSDSSCLPPCTSNCPDVSAQCESDIAWAMSAGIYQNPEWYPGLSAHSTKDDFQKHLSSLPDSNCPEPCGDELMTS